MVTKYIGAATELNNAKMIALVYSSDLLIESDIPDYYPTYFGAGYKTSLYVDYDPEGNPQFVYDTEQEGELFTFNSIIFYASNSEPIGFTMLDSAINLVKFHIVALTITPRFEVASNGAFVNVEIGTTKYANHIANTNKSHKRLLRIENGAIPYQTIDKDKVHAPKFTSQLNVALDNNAVYKYSGNLCYGTEKLIPKKFENLSLSEDQFHYSTYSDSTDTFYTIDDRMPISKFLRFMKISGVDLLIEYDVIETEEEETIIETPTVTYRILEDGVSGHIELEGTVIAFGSNYIVSIVTIDNTEFLRFTALHIDRTKLVASTSSEVELSRLSGYRFTHNLDTYELHMYKIDNGNLITQSSKLKECCDLLGFTKFNDVEYIVGFTEGALAYLNTSEVTCIKTNAVSTSSGQLTSNTEFKCDLNWEKIEMISNKSFLFRIKGAIIDGVDTRRWKLLKISKEDNTGMYESKVIDLGEVDSPHRIDLFAMFKVSVTDLSLSRILFSPYKGRIYKCYSNITGAITSIMEL